MEREREIREKREKAHEELLKKSQTNDLEQALLRKKQQQDFQDLLQRLMAAQRPFLDAPNTNFKGEVATDNKHFNVAVGEMQGWRNSMEDNHFIKVDGLQQEGKGPKKAEEGLFGVFDGHSGKQAADYCAAQMAPLCEKYYKPEGIQFEEVFLEMDRQLEKKVNDDSGCTSVVVHVTPKVVRCASVGDSRAVLCRRAAATANSEEVFEVNGVSYEAVALSYDHKPEVPEEQARIEAIGGHVQANRVNGQLAMSRALGDFTYKQNKDKKVEEQLVIPNPTVIEAPRAPEDVFVVLACDGIFDVLTNKELCMFIMQQKEVEKVGSNKEICEKTCRHCLAPADGPGGQCTRAEGTDNMTIMIVDLL
ncbi:protein phosphatase [Angomonas deanei]|uniref:protein-serine/threonine phosphatase n=1 Tax=Angomonas deanei TaxID=59799 RepID=S9UBZ3_9TRYP|nr:protein phosphatase [Angomonas deanei]EPY28333.1 protein phosphatase [Angomonas deanei]CAD2221863.1 Protein phosphatase 2C, putative [Angomonas deanei]|eukprot:EPY26458.1 protein phosphatase [Angomonas deanei]